MSTESSAAFVASHCSIVAVRNSSRLKGARNGLKNAISQRNRDHVVVLPRLYQHGKFDFGTIRRFEPNNTPLRSA